MSSELQEALTSANVTALTPKIIDPVLLEYQRRFSPLVYSIPTVQWGSTQYFFNRRTARGAGGFVTDGGARSVSNSTYAQFSFNIRLLQTIGAVTGFSQAVTRDLVGDLKRLEVEGSAQSLIWDLETALMWGSDGATNAGTAPQFNGLDTLVSNFVAGTDPINSTDVAGSTLALSYLDRLIDYVELNAAMPVMNSDFMFVMSTTAESKIAQLLTAQQRFVDRVEVAPGLITPSYRNIPIVKSSFLSARSYSQGTVTTGTATTGGTLAAATYYYQVAAVIARLGEIVASTEVSQVTTGATSTVTLNITAPSGLDGAGPILYKVYRSTATGAETLIGIVDANDTTGAAVTSIIDTGTNLLTNSSGNTGPAAYVGTNTGLKPLATGQENIYLVPRNQDFLVRPWVRDMTVLPLAPTVTQPDVLPYAIVTDTCLAIRAPRFVARLARVGVSL